MAIQNKALGKGISSIFLENSESESGSLTMLRINDIEPRKGQPRKIFDSEALAQLADSIAAHGIIQPIVVRKSIGGFYEIIAGERRWRAAKMAGLMEVPVVVMDTDDQKTTEISLIENIQREDLNPIEEANAYKILMQDFSLTQENVAQRVGKSRSTITNSLRLLDLPSSVITMLSDGTLSAGHARALLGLQHKSNIAKAADIIVAKGLSVRATEELVRRMNIESNKAKDKSDVCVPEVNYIAAIEKALRARLNRKVKIVSGKKNKKIEIEYTDENDLNNLLSILGGENLLDE